VWLAGLPTVFVAEGLLYYLTEEVNAKLLRTLADLSALGVPLGFRFRA
jgi:O-methyltransferase involved in polyketide biosynthesis